MKTSVMLMGTGPRSGKSLASLGLCRTLANRGVAVAPFKAICVIQEQDMEDRTLPLHAHGLYHHLRAARLPFHLMMNPIAVIVTGPLTGDLYIKGEYVQAIQLLNDDALYFRSIPPPVLVRMREVVVAAFQAVANDYDCLIIEGAGCPGEVPPDEDIPNIYVSTVAQAPILVSTRISRGGSSASIIGTCLTLPDDLRPLIRGYILGDIHTTHYIEHIRQTIETHLHIPFVGTITNLSLADLSDEEAYELIAQATEKGFSPSLFNELMSQS